MPLCIVEFAYAIGDRVYIDGDQSLVAIVTACVLRAERLHVYDVSFVHNGIPQTFAIDAFRLSPAIAHEE